MTFISFKPFPNVLNYFLDFYQSNEYHDYINIQAIKSELAISIYFNSSFPNYIITLGNLKHLMISKDRRDWETKEKSSVILPKLISFKAGYNAHCYVITHSFQFMY